MNFSETDKTTRRSDPLSRGFARLGEELARGMQSRVACMSNRSSQILLTLI